MPASSLEHSHNYQEVEASSGKSTLSKLMLASLQLARPMLPYLLPFIVCTFSIPILILLSGTAGWFVWRSVPVGWNVEAYLQYGETMNPFAITKVPNIISDQPYDISLHLILPTTESNYALGNFMSTLQISTAYNESIASVRRPMALVPPRPSLIRQALWGTPAIVELTIPLLYHFTAGTSHIIVRLEIGRSDAWKSLGNGHSRELTVLKTALVGIIRPTGIRAILARYPRLMTFISSFTFFFISIIVVSIFIFSAIGGGSSGQDANKDDQYTADDSDGNDSSPGNSSRSVSRRRSKQIARDHEGDDDVKSFPSGIQSQGAVELRRRRSRGDPTASHPSQIKIEIQDDPSLKHSASAVYPKSPFPREVAPHSTSASPDEPKDIIGHPT